MTPPSPPHQPSIFLSISPSVPTLGPQLITRSDDGQVIRSALRRRPPPGGGLHAEPPQVGLPSFPLCQRDACWASALRKAGSWPARRLQGPFPPCPLCPGWAGGGCDLGFIEGMSHVLYISPCLGCCVLGPGGRTRVKLSTAERADGKRSHQTVLPGCGPPCHCLSPRRTPVRQEREFTEAPVGFTLSVSI